MITRTGFQPRVNVFTDLNVFELPVETYSPVMQMAYDLTVAGFNLMPLPAGVKSWEYKFKHIVLAGKLSPQHAAEFFRPLPDGKNPNIAVITGHTSNGLFILDCETVAAADTLINDLRQHGLIAGLHFWVVTTGRGKHVWIRTNGDVKSIPLGKYPYSNVEVIASGKYGLAPLSVHPKGPLYQFETRGSVLVPVPFKALKFLHLERHTPQGKGNLKKAENARRGVPVGQRNNEVFKSATCWYSVGLPDNVVESRALEIAPTLPTKELHKTLRSAKKTAHDKTYVAGATIYEMAMQFSASYQWDNRTRDRAVFEALCERAKMDKSARFRGSVREIAALAGCSESTVSRKAKGKKGALQRLQDAKIIVRVGYAGGNLWQFGSVVFEVMQGVMMHTLHTEGVKVHVPSVRTITPTQNDIYHNETTALLADLWRRKGANSKRIYTYLLDNPQPTHKAIAAALNLKLDSVRWCVRWLLECGLVQHGGGDNSYYSTPPTALPGETLGKIEDMLGNRLGATKRQLERHAVERSYRRYELMVTLRTALEAYVPPTPTERHIDPVTGEIDPPAPVDGSMDTQNNSRKISQKNTLPDEIAISPNANLHEVDAATEDIVQNFEQLPPAPDDTSEPLPTSVDVSQNETSLPPGVKAEWSIPKNAYTYVYTHPQHGRLVSFDAKTFRHPVKGVTLDVSELPQKR